MFIFTDCHLGLPVDTYLGQQTGVLQTCRLCSMLLLQHCPSGNAAAGGSDDQKVWLVQATDQLVFYT